MRSIARLGAILLVMVSVGSAVLAEETDVEARRTCTAAVSGAPPWDPYRRMRSTADQPDDHPGAYQIQGHLDSQAKGGASDLMFQAPEGDPTKWGCGQPNAAAICVLDPGRSEYFGLPAGSCQVDLAKSVFLEPTVPDAVPPPGWQEALTPTPAPPPP